MRKIVFIQANSSYLEIQIEFIMTYERLVNDDIIS